MPGLHTKVFQAHRRPEEALARPPGQLCQAMNLQVDPGARSRGPGPPACSLTSRATARPPQLQRAWQLRR